MSKWLKADFVYGFYVVSLMRARIHLSRICIRHVAQHSKEHDALPMGNGKREQGNGKLGNGK